MKNITKYLVVLLLIAGISSGCDEFLSPSVDQNKPTETAVQNVSDLEAVIYGAYDDLNEVELYGREFYVSGDVMSDNAFSNGNSGRFIDQDGFQFTVNSGYVSDVWEFFYQAIADANLGIHADLETSTEVDHFKGQAYAVRAFSHFNLLLAFGQQYVDGGDQGNGIPYMLEYKTADEAEEEDFIPGRDAIDDVWANIESDLDEAVNRLDPESQVATELDYWAARALQTRYYLYTEQYDQVVSIAEEIIDSGEFEITTAGNLVDTWESGEGPQSLFELAFTTTDRFGTDNIARIYRPSNYGDVEVSDDLYDAHQEDDVRLDLYESDDGIHRMMSKYSDELGSDNVRLIRYAEVVLNYAEALAQGAGGQMTAEQALAMLTDNRYEDGSPYSTIDVENVWHERRLELAMEGHRLYDLLRTGRDIPVGDSGSYRTEVIPYGSYLGALPVPDSEVRANSNVTQNEGYN